MKIFACLVCVVVSLISQPCHQKDFLDANFIEEHKPFVVPTSKLFYPRKLKDVFPDSPEPKMNLDLTPQAPTPKTPDKSKPRKPRYSPNFVVMRGEL